MSGCAFPSTRSTIAAKKHGPSYCGILVPNPYFLDYDHAKERDGRLARVAATPWARRDSRPFWRGKLRAPKPVWKSKFYGAFVLNRRVALHAIDATPARWRGDAGSSPLDRARTAAPSLRNDL